MPRPRTPTAILDARGALAHDSKRYAHRTSEPQPTKPLGSAPAHLTKDQKKVWRELATTAPADVLTGCDRWVVESAVMLMSLIRSGNFTTATIAQLRSCLASMGMTPADRSRVSAKKQELNPDDEWTDLIQ
jgi:phage terminase small subunit